MAEHLNFPITINGQKAVEVLSSLLKPKTDLTYRSCMDFTLSNADLTQSLLNGTIFRQCSFVNLNFSRCDFDGVVFENCKFNKCSFNDAQFIGATASGCEFNSCLLNGLYLVDCTFANSSFALCNLEGAVVNACDFHTVTFSASPLSKATIILNKYYSCTFWDMILGDCTFVLNIFEKCIFNNTLVNADAIGQSFGITHGNMSNINICFLGESIKRDERTDLIQDILDEYKGRNWILPYFIGSYNFNRIDSFGFCKGIYHSIDLFMSRNLLIKKDDLKFIASIIQAQVNKNKFPGICLIELREKIYNTIGNNKDEGIISIKNRDVLWNFYNSLHTMLDNFYASLIHKTAHLSAHKEDVAVTARFAFKTKPDIPLEDYMRDLAIAINISPCQATRTISQENGSFIEILQTSIYTILLFQIVLYLVDGCLVQATKIRSRVQGLTGSSLPKTYKKYENTLIPDAPLYTLRFLKDAVQLLRRGGVNRWLAKGFNENNLESINYSEEK